MIDKNFLMGPGRLQTNFEIYFGWFEDIKRWKKKDGFVDAIVHVFYLWWSMKRTGEKSWTNILGDNITSVEARHVYTPESISLFKVGGWRAFRFNNRTYVFYVVPVKRN